MNHTLHAQETYAQLILNQLTHRLDTAITQVIDIIRVLDAVIDLDDVLHEIHQVALGEDALLDLIANAAVQLVAPHLAQDRNGEG